MVDSDGAQEQDADARLQPTCPVMGAADLLGDRWTLLILRDAFNGIQRFSQFQRSLGIAKNVLSARLSALVAADVLRTEPGADGTSYRAYVLTDKGCELFDLIVALRQWGERYLIDEGTSYRPLIDTRTGEPLLQVAYRRHDGTMLRHTETRLGQPRPMPARERPRP